MDIDVEIYMKNFIKFFKENPNNLLSLVPKHKEEEFYQKIREVVLENGKKASEVTITKSQLIEVCKELNSEAISESNSSDKTFLNTKYGLICMN